MPTDDEAAALAALFARPGAAAIAAAPAPAAPGGGRLIGGIAGTAVSLGLIPFLAPPIERLPAIAGMLIEAALLTLIAFAGSRVASVRMPGAGARARARAGQGIALGLGGLGWCALALALGHRLAGGGVALGGLWIVGVACTLAQTASEEILFRGFFQTALARLLPAPLALLLAALLFGTAHLVGGERAAPSLANITIAGLLFGVLAWRTAGLAAPIAAHFGWNAGEELLFGLDPNPGHGPFGTLLDLDIVATPLWGGSTEGLNASPLVTLVLAALLLVALALRPAGGQPE